jgi:hypothetical protein
MSALQDVRDRLTRLREEWAKDRAPYEKLIGKRVTGTDMVNTYKGTLISVGKMAMTAVIKEDDGPKVIVFCESVEEVESDGGVPA